MKDEYDRLIQLVGKGIEFQVILHDYCITGRLLYVLSMLAKYETETPNIASKGF